MFRFSLWSFCSCCRASKRLLLLDYDGTLVDQNAIDNKPNAEVLKVVEGLCADPNNFVFIISGRARTELSHWFDPSVSSQCPLHAPGLQGLYVLGCCGHTLTRGSVQSSSLMMHSNVHCRLALSYHVKTSSNASC